MIMTTFSGIEIKEAFARFLGENPKIRAVMVGVRRQDPHCAQLHSFDPTDNGWPAFVRVHPILEWHYPDVWRYLRGNSVPYCVLYDRGYTSLGDRSRTLPNPALRIENDRYRPAYLLEDEEEERAGRL